MKELTEEVIMGKATLVKLDGTEHTLNHKPSLKEAQDMVGGYIELVKVGHGQTLVVDEEGKTKNKPVNKRITTIFGTTIYGGHMVGDVIVLEGWRTVGS